MNRGILRQVFWLEALAIEKKAYHGLYDAGLISGAVFEELNLMMNLKQDAVQAKQIPPNVLTASPLEVRLEKFLAGIIGRILPERRSVKHRERAISFASAQRAIADKYEYDAATAYVGELVAEEVSRLAEASGLDPTVASDCQDTYRRISQEAIQRLEARAEHSPELARKLQELLAHRVTVLTEEAALKRLTVEGALNQQVADKLQLQLEG